MVMFRTSGHHAAVHHGQFDYIGWFPNNPMILLKPPPSAKGQSGMETILETLPDQGTTAKILSSIVVISHRVPLGQYPSEHFGEASSKQMIKAFQGELSYLSEEITKRNSELALPYLYLNPAQIENSVAQ
ncbi:hypothetical protein CRUP_035083 [Coryphaenoides rupestris]|nr:hypothetical protein CRUP_035083 [Coryphaenoides rupestris]